MISQYLLTAILLFMEGYFATAEGGSRLTRMGVCAAILGGIVLVWCPNFSNALAHAVGISRGADLVMYLWILMSFLIMGRLRLRLWRIEREMTVVTRQVALINAGLPPMPSAGSNDRNNCDG